MTSALDISMLREEYELTLKQYNDAYNLYMEQLNNNSETNKFTKLDQRAWWGTTALTEGASENSTDCETMCANDPECSGATFNPEAKYCWVRGGKGVVSVNKDTSAIIFTNKHNVKILQALNNKLLRLNKQIAEIMADTTSQYNLNKQDQAAAEKTLKIEEEKLDEENKRLIGKLEEYLDITEEVDNQTLFATRQYMLLWLLVLLGTILVAIALYSFGNIGKLLDASSNSITSIMTGDQA